MPDEVPRPDLAAFEQEQADIMLDRLERRTHSIQRQSTYAINGKSQRAFADFTSKLALYSAGALSLSITFVTSIAASHSKALLQMSEYLPLRLSMSNLSVLFMGWGALALSLLLSLGSKEAHAQYSMNFGLRNLTDSDLSLKAAYRDYQRRFMSTGSRTDMPTIEVCEAALSKYQKTLPAQTRRASRYLHLSHRAMLVAESCFVLGLGCLALFATSFLLAITRSSL